MKKYSNNQAIIQSSNHSNNQAIKQSSNHKTSSRSHMRVVLEPFRRMVCPVRGWSVRCFLAASTSGNHNRRLLSGLSLTKLNSGPTKMAWRSGIAARRSTMAWCSLWLSAPSSCMAPRMAILPGMERLPRLSMAAFILEGLAL